MTPELEDCLKLADREALAYSKARPSNSVVANTVLIFAKAVVMLAQEYRKAQPVIEAAKDSVGVHIGIDGAEIAAFRTESPGVAQELMDALEVYDGLKPMPIDIVDIHPKADLAAPLIESVESEPARRVS